MTVSARLATTLFLVLLTAATLLVIYWLLLDSRPKFTSPSVSVTTIRGDPADTFRRGEAMVVLRENCAQREIDTSISRGFVNVDTDTTHVIPGSDYLMPKGCHTTVREVQIPQSLPPGRYRYVVVVRYGANPLLSDTVVVPTPIINIMP